MWRQNKITQDREESRSFFYGRKSNHGARYPESPCALSGSNNNAIKTCRERNFDSGILSVWTDHLNHRVGDRLAYLADTDCLSAFVSRRWGFSRSKRWRNLYMGTQKLKKFYRVRVLLPIPERGENIAPLDMRVMILLKTMINIP